MPFTFTKADMFTEIERINPDAVVNTVNCVGVMGKGIALAFKKSWPENYKAYKKSCENKNLRPGKMFVFESGQALDPCEPKFIINFPTKDHWRANSKMSFIEKGLDDLVKQIEKHNIKSIIIPALGCGNGGLNWHEVKPLIEKKLTPLAEGGVNLVITEPKLNLSMTAERAGLLQTIIRLYPILSTIPAGERMQFIIYYLQSYGLEFKLKFEKTKNYPSSKAVNKVLEVFDSANLITISKHEPQIKVTDGGKQALTSFIQKSEKFIEIDEVIASLQNSIENNEKLFFTRLVLVHWLKKVKKRDNTAILRAFNTKRGIIKKLNFYPDTLTELQIAEIERYISQQKPLIHLR